MIIIVTIIIIVMITTKGGGIWTKTSAPQGSWEGIAISSDGTKIAAGQGSQGFIYISPNG